MKVIFMGTPDFAVGTLAALIDSKHQVTAVITQPDKPKGRGKAVQFTPVKEVALKHDIPVYQPKRVRDKETIELLASISADVIVVVAFGQIVPKEILEMKKYGCINVHASLLPKYRGAAPIQWAIIDGESESGVTTMQMDEGLDTGDILQEAVVPLAVDETGGSLFDKLSELGAGLLLQTLAAAQDGELKPRKQGDSPTPYAKMLKKEMGLIDWNQSALQIERLIRGLCPWPSAYTYLDGKTLKIWQAEVLAENTKKAAGQISEIKKESIKVQTGEGVLKIKEVQLEGKKRMAVDSFLRGYQIKEETSLGKCGEY